MWTRKYVSPLSERCSSTKGVGVQRGALVVGIVARGHSVVAGALNIL